MSYIVNEIEYAQWKRNNRKDYSDPNAAPYSEIVLPGTTRHEVGQTATLDKVEYSLLGVVESRGTQYDRPQEGYTFILCEFEVLNGTSEEIYLYSSDMQAYADEYLMDDTYSALSAVESKARLSGDIAAGKRMKGFVGYEVPEDWQTLEIFIKSKDYRNVEQLVFTIHRDDIENVAADIS